VSKSKQVKFQGEAGSLTLSPVTYDKQKNEIDIHKPFFITGFYEKCKILQKSLQI
jgi:hypothetical protein